jgi:hypothetical protein
MAPAQSLAQGQEAWLDGAVPRLAWPDFPFHARGVTSIRGALHWASEHTGLPVTVVAAVALVLSWRLAKRTAHLAIELVVAFAIVLLATKLGWIRW